MDRDGGGHGENDVRDPRHVAFSEIGVLGDAFLKLASAREQSLRSGWFGLGFVLYASTAFGWVFVMKHLKLATIGASTRSRWCCC